VVETLKNGVKFQTRRLAEINDRMLPAARLDSQSRSTTTDPGYQPGLLERKAAYQGYLQAQDEISAKVIGRRELV
jgi:hypothetical protein